MSRYHLTEIPTRAPEEASKKELKEQTKKILEELDLLQNLLYAEGKHSVLIVLQGMDASGKDGLIKNVFGAMNPQGVQVTSFKVPTEEEAAHDFLWRIHKNTPGKGRIQIFNRSHYEDVLVTRVHNACDDETAEKRFNAINAFEQLLQQSNTVILKFYLHVSAAEQAERLKERMDNPEKMWKYNKNDFKEAALRDKYYRYYEECFQKCNHPEWMIVPSDQNWFKEYTVAHALKNALKGLGMRYPGIDQ
ncbi:MAG: polyphosphate kinase [Niabella sp.]